ncbi:MAG: hypothetical protein ACRD9R_00870 [Pyrinomonadaceae bacterium]
MRKTFAAAIYLIALSVQTSAQCQSPLSAETLNQLTTRLSGEEIEMWAGQTLELRVFVPLGCYGIQEVNPCVVWSVDHAAVAAIDPHTGRLTVNENAKHDSLFTVTADVENGRRLMPTKVRVYTREGNPLVGSWRQARSKTGANGEPMAVEGGIGELRFRADGTFSVTWVPFECYKDYGGTYSFDQKSGSLKLELSKHGNFIPPDLDLEGDVSFDGGRLLKLRGICLGSKKAGARGGGCDLSFSLN